MLQVDERNGFSVREKGYDVGEVNARIAALQARIDELESHGSRAAVDDLSGTRLEALRLLVAAREDAEAMVDEARREARAIVAAALPASNSAEPVATLAPHLEVIKAELPVPTQHAFVAVVTRRTG